MALTIETGAGVAAAQSYSTVAYVTAYLTERGRETENSWSTLGATAQEQAIVKATDHIERAFGAKFGGQKEWTDLRQARELLTFAAQPADSETVTVGASTYTFVSSLSSALDVLIGDDYLATALNLIGAINGIAAKAGATHGTGTVANASACAQSFYGTSVLVYAKNAGEPGNAIALSSTAANVAAGAATLSGGSSIKKAQPLSFPRKNLYDRDGLAIVSIPDKLKDAVAEYAVRAASAELVLDPDSGLGGGAIKMKREIVGPIEEVIEYQGGTTLSGILPQYPAADLLLAEFIDGAVYSGIGNGRTIRG